MDMSYLRGRLDQAKAADADIVKVDIEEFASLLDTVEKYPQEWSKAYEQGKEAMSIKMLHRIHQVRDIFNELVSLVENGNSQIDS